jgi:serine/threonine-protein kinase
VAAAEPCLGDDTLACFGAQTLSPDESARVRRHLDACAGCRRLLADVVGGEAPSRDDDRELATPKRLDVTASDPGPPVAAAGGPRLVTAGCKPGDVVGGKYRIDRVLGSGGMGTVFGATHLDLRHTVAIKTLDSRVARDPDMVRRFMREGRAAAQLKSDNALRIFDVGSLGSGVPYLVMELLDGEDLEVIASRRRVEVSEAVEWIGQAAHALAEAHGRGLVHRDLKPHNLFLTRLADGCTRIKVVDFGLVKELRVHAAASGMTTDGMMLGSPLYMSPEQIRTPGKVDARCDVWALGATLYRLLAGRPPFHGNTTPILLAHILTDDFTPLRALRLDVSDALDRAVVQALAKEVERRFPSVMDFVHAVEAALSRAPSVVTPRTRREAAHPFDTITLVDRTDTPAPTVSAAPPPPLSTLVEGPRDMRPAPPTSLLAEIDPTRRSPGVGSPTPTGPFPNARPGSSSSWGVGAPRPTPVAPPAPASSPSVLIDAPPRGTSRAPLRSDEATVRRPRPGARSFPLVLVLVLLVPGFIAYAVMTRFGRPSVKDPPPAPGAAAQH